MNLEEIKTKLKMTIRSNYNGSSSFKISLLPPEYLDNKELVLFIIENRVTGIYKYLNKDLQEDKDIALAVVKLNGMEFKNLSSALQNDQDLAYAAITQQANIFQFMNEELRSNKTLIIKAVLKIPRMFKYVPSEKRYDRDFLLSVMPSIPLIYGSVSTKFSKDRQLALIAIEHRGDNLFHAPKYLKDDEILVRKILDYCPNAFQYASDRLKSQKSLVEYAVSCQANNILYVQGECANDKKLILSAVNAAPYLIFDLSKKWKDDFDVALIAVKFSYKCYKILNDDLKSNKHIALEFVSKADKYFVRNNISKELIEEMGQKEQNYLPYLQKAVAAENLREKLDREIPLKNNVITANKKKI